MVKKQKTIKLDWFKKLRKTKKALEQLEDKELRQEILKAYRTKCHKPQWSITRKDLADRVFSEYIRLNESKDGICKCVTCWAEMPWEQIQNWHFISRGNMFYRFSEVNCHPQCQQCNIFLNWNYPKYTIYMINRYWLEETEFMIEDKTTKEYKQYEYEEMIIKWYWEIVELKRKIKR